MQDKESIKKRAYKRYGELIDKKYEEGLTPDEQQELNRLKDALSELESKFYGSPLKKLQQTQEEKFLKELRDLLAKYNATISFLCDGDTYGIYDEHMEILIGDKTISQIDGFHIDANNI